MPNIRWLLALITAAHRLVYRASAGRIGHRAGGKQFLLLRSVGRKTGLLRITPLLYVDDGDRWIVAGSNAGNDRSPAWWLNLEARPDADIQVGARRFAVRARKAAPEESERLWPLLEASYPHYLKYRERTQREIPSVILEPRPSDSEAGDPE
jgi:deazaflavin-dependent oxidoreductase (nitroreductase family)